MSWPPRRGRYFNPRSSCEERRESCAYYDNCLKFQSTLLMRGATRSGPRGYTGYSNFNPRSSCEERLDVAVNRVFGFGFQSTLLMRGATDAAAILIILCNRFQSTLLMRGATRPSCTPDASASDFNPRSSCEERPGVQKDHATRRDFNPRSSCEERPMSISCKVVFL